MKRSPNDSPTLHFRGTPRALHSLVGLAYADVGPTPRISMNEPATSVSLGAVFAFDAGGKASRLQVSLSESTPPGVYKGSAEMAGKSFPIEIHVEPFVYLAMSPRQLVVTGYAGEKQLVDLIVANSGNVSCEIGGTYAFGLYDVHGAERGIGAAFRQPEANGDSRVDRMFEELAAGYGGMVRVQVEEGYGTIAPGDVRPLRLNLHIPAGVQAGHTYTGTLALQNLRYYVEFRTTAAT